MSQNPTRVFYDRLSAVYDLMADAGEHRAMERGLTLLAAQPNERMLEIGFGTGRALIALAEAVGPDGRVVGVDLSDGMRNVTSRRVAQAHLDDRVTLRREEVPPLSDDDATFDAVFMSFTLELFPTPRIPEVLREVRRVLTPRGRLGVVAMATVRPGEPESALERGYKWMHRHFPHIVDCQPIDVERLIVAAGYTLIRQERMDLFTMPVAVVMATPSA